MRVVLLLLSLLGAGASIVRAQEIEELEPVEEVETEAAEPIAEEAKPSAAEEAAETPEAGFRGRLVFDAEDWIAQPTGLEYSPATQSDPSDPVGTRVLGVPTGTDGAFRARLGFVLPKSWGRLVGTYFSHNEAAGTTQLDPGRFIFGETVLNPLYAGFNNDGLADGFEADTYTSLHDYRLELYRPAFRTARLAAEWSIGWRRASHSRRITTTYLALVPDIPTVIPPVGDFCCPDLEPTAEIGESKSRFEGRGPSGGFDVRYDLWKDRLGLEAGFSLAVLRGKTDSDYTSQTNVYLFEGAVVGPPYDVFIEDTNPDVAGIQPFGALVTQQPFPVGLEGQSVSTSANILEGTFAFRFKALEWLDVVAGFRSTRYDDVGLDMRPKVVTASIDSLENLVYNIQDVTETRRSVTYEGFFGGLTFYLY
jgi:hypothetical protein